MQVEVGARQSGKTTRLIESVINFLTNNPDKTALIVTCNGYMRKEIQQKIHSKCGRPCEFRTITSYKMLPPVPNSTLKQFVDEFWSINPKHLVVDKNAYYTTTIDHRINEKGLEIWNVYRGINSLKPNTFLKKHGFGGND